LFSVESTMTYRESAHWRSILI